MLFYKGIIPGYRVNILCRSKNSEIKLVICVVAQAADSMPIKEII